VVGLGGFGPPSRAPEAHSLDHASRQPLNPSLVSSGFKQNLALILKTLPKIQHLSKANQRAINYRLMRIAKEEIDFNIPSEVESFVYSMDTSNNYKNKILQAYYILCQSNNIEFKKPKLLAVQPFVIRIPTEERIDKIISCCHWVYSTVFALSKYGLRPDEISKLTLRNFDLEHNQLTVSSSKQGLQRTIQLKRQTVELLRDYLVRRKIISIDQRLFASVRKIKATWRYYRQKAYGKLKDPELLSIRLYDLRHWFATATYLQTRDIFFVKYLLGHRKLDNTLIYVHLANGLTNFNEDYVSQVAKNIEEATKLVESGFEYVTTFDNIMLLKKRK
jgi:integrase